MADHNILLDGLQNWAGQSLEQSKTAMLRTREKNRNRGVVLDSVLNF